MNSPTLLRERQQAGALALDHAGQRLDLAASRMDHATRPGEAIDEFSFARIEAELLAARRDYRAALSALTGIDAGEIEQRLQA